MHDAADVVPAAGRAGLGYAAKPGTRQAEDGSRAYHGPELDALAPYLNEALAEWADTAFTSASLSCSHDHVDASSCAWYHGAWPALRMLDVVSSPAWHHEFYSANLRLDIRDSVTPRILISGVADFSMLAFVLAAVKGIDPQPEIHVIDCCRTPLDACVWYAHHAGGRVAVDQQSVLSPPETLVRLCGGQSGDLFDLITTDALLTRFTRPGTEQVVAGWFSLLRRGGSVVTTVRLHPRDVPGESSADVSGFVSRVAELARLRRFPKIKDEDLVAAASLYAQKMTSHDLGDVNEILALFREVGFVIEHQEVAPVKGEVTPTEYLRLVARKPVA